MARVWQMYMYIIYKYIYILTTVIGLELNSNRYKYFRWTPRTAWVTFVYVALVPSIVGYIGYKYDVR